MSIDFDQWDRINRINTKITKKVKSVLGYAPLEGDHWGRLRLFNEYIDLKTDKNTIKEIYEKFEKLCLDIISMFNDLKLKFKPEYFTVNDPMHSTVRFFGKRVNVYEGIEGLETAIRTYANMYHKVKPLISNFDKFNEKYFYALEPDEKNEIQFMLYNSIVNSHTTDVEIESIISSFYNLNKRINDLLILCDYGKLNQVYPNCGQTLNIYNYEEITTYREYYLFSKQISQDTHDSEIIRIIYQARLFESNVKSVLNEYGSKDEYNIVYETQVTIWFSNCGYNMGIDISYEILKKRLKDRAINI